jgi:hypothetical protein
MNEKPLLIFPVPLDSQRHNKSGGPTKYHFPAATAQKDRLDPKFTHLERAFAARRAEVRDTIVGVEPERVLVFETVGKVEDFFKAVRGIEGLEWLTEWDEDSIKPDENFYKEGTNNQETQLSGRVYLIMSNQRGMQELLSLWKIFKDNPDAPTFQRGRTKWRDLFKQLKEIRPWGAEDRIRETGLLEDWQERVNAHQEDIRVEVELWFRGDEKQRTTSANIVSRLVENEEGSVVGQCVIPEISYHALLIEAPIRAIERILSDHNTLLVQCEQVMFFRPVGQAAVVIPEDEPVSVPPLDDDFAITDPYPVVALLDGLPLENHQLLANRLIVDDPDEWADDYPANNRNHGTAMASLILNGELDASETFLTRPIYVRPILKPDPFDWRSPKREAVPENVLLVDLIHRAVRRMFESDGEEPPAAPTIKIINLSIGDKGRVFDYATSPLARLIDYLSWKYNVLFLVSAGNYPDEIELDIPRDKFDELKSDPNRLESEIVKAIAGKAITRRLLSPAESINALTIGATHVDFSSGDTNGSMRLNPIRDGFPSPINAQGPGFRKGIKPEILIPGGRQTYTEKLGTTHTKATLRLSEASTPPGQRVATPGVNPGDLNKTRHVRGTSNSTALASRTADRLYDTVIGLRDQPEGDRLGEDSIPLLIKSLLVHGASWGELGDFIQEALGQKNKDTVSRLLGYGNIQPDRVVACADERATLIGFGSLHDGDGHLYTVPLPPSLNSQAVWRRLTVTLSWFTPINTNHNAYRKASLWFSPHGATKEEGHVLNVLQIERRDADARTVRRGTVQHEVFEGKRAAVFTTNDSLEIQVNCKGEAGELTDAVSYSLVVTLEVAEKDRLPVYEEIRSLIRPTVGITAGTSGQ